MVCCCIEVTTIVINDAYKTCWWNYWLLQGRCLIQDYYISAMQIRMIPTARERRNSYFSPQYIIMLGWRVGVWLSDPEKREGSEETAPTRRSADPSGTWREPWQQSRNETSTWTWRWGICYVECAECEALKRLSCRWKGQTVANEESTWRRG